MCREAGQRMDKFGCMLQGNFAYKEQLSRHRRIMPLYDRLPTIGQNAFVAPDAAVIGQVALGARSTVWYGAVLKADLNDIFIGEMSSIGDRSVLTTSNGYLFAPDLRLYGRFPTTIGNRCIVEPCAVLHSCTLEDECIVGTGSLVFEGAVVGRHAIVGAGSVVPQGTHIPSGELWSGHPASFERNLTAEEIQAIPKLAQTQFELGKKHDAEHEKSWKQITEDKYVEENYHDMEEPHRTRPLD